jgi:MEMO1 family protein
MDEFYNTFRPAIRSDLRTGRQCYNRKGHIAAIVQDPVFKGLFHPGYQMSSQIAQMFPYLDGKTELSDLPELLQRELGVHLSLDGVRKVIAGLARYDLLDTLEIRQKHVSLEATFRQTPIRPMCDPTGTFYPTNPYELGEAIQDCFLTAHTDEEDKGSEYSCFSPLSSSPLALLLPHGALRASGHTMARALQVLLSTPLPDRYIIIGPNHIYPGSPCATTISHPFQTPLGEVEADGEAISLLGQLSEGHIISDYISHYRDHSVEIILPFLQWIHAKSTVTPNKAVRIVPLLLTGERHRPGMYEPESHSSVWQQIGQAITHFLSLSKERTIVIVSGDFVHKGPLFHFVPFSGAEKKDFYSWDRPLLEAIQEADAERFLNAYQATNCCVGRPMYTALKALEGYHWFMADYHVMAVEENAVAFASFVAYSNV